MGLKECGYGYVDYFGGLGRLNATIISGSKNFEANFC